MRLLKRGDCIPPFTSLPALCLEESALEKFENQIKTTRAKLGALGIMAEHLDK